MSYKSQYTGSQIDEGIEKANKALTTPDTAPESISLVAVDTNNAQSMLTLGDGLSVADGVISASGGSNPVYEHSINIRGYSDTQCANLGFSVFNNSPEPFTDLTSAINALLGDNYDYQFEMPARGFACDFDTAPVGGEVSGDFTMYFVTSLSAKRTPDAIEVVRFWGAQINLTQTVVGTKPAGHQIAEVFAWDDFIMSPATFEDYGVYDTVRQIV